MTIETEDSTFKRLIQIEKEIRDQLALMDMKIKELERRQEVLSRLEDYWLRSGKAYSTGCTRGNSTYSKRTIVQIACTKNFNIIHYPR